jgi:esterase/lipase
MLTIEDLKPKSFTVKVKGVELECKPLRMSHTLVISKVGEIFQNIGTVDKKQIQQAEADMDEVIAELIPELKEIQLDMQGTLDLITSMMENIQPADNKELTEKGVEFNSDPKVEKLG